MSVTSQRGFADPAIHGVTRMSAVVIDFDDGAYVGLSFGQGDECAIRPECQIFGGPEMKGKFNRLAAAVNEIFGETIEAAPKAEAPAFHMPEIPF